LRAGGVTLYFRHVATDFSQNDERYVEGDCATQRNLTDAGRDDARRLRGPASVDGRPTDTGPRRDGFDGQALVVLVEEDLERRLEDCLVAPGVAGPSGRAAYGAIDGRRRLVSGHSDLL
jgi:hypothetical protein